jgi:hypothetical protein
MAGGNQFNNLSDLNSYFDSLPKFSENEIEIDGVSRVYQAISNFYTQLFESLLTNNNDTLPPPQYDPLFTTQTPASDVAFAGFGDYQLVFGRAGNDLLYPFDHRLNPFIQTSLHIDVFFGDSEPIKLSLLQDTLSILLGNPPTTSGTLLPTGQDRFVLSDWKTSYYDQLGYQDFGFIYDFNPNQDTIQLRSSASNYETVTVPFLGGAIFENKAGSSSVFENELVGIVFGPGNYNLDLNASYFSYVDSTPPAGLVQLEIKQFGTSGLDIPTAITVDAWGNVYTAGFTNGALEGPNSGSYDVWINKYDSSGNQLWGQQLGSSKIDTSGFGLATDKWGNVYLEGNTAGNLVTPLQAENLDAFFIKLDSNGNLLWSRQFGSDYGSSATNVTVDDNGNAYFSGLTIKLDPRPVTDPNRIFPVQDDFWATKYDTNGNQLWFTEVGAPLNSFALFDEAYDITLNTDGSVYTTGWTFGDFSGQGQFNAYDIQIAKYNSSTGQLEDFSPNPGQFVNQFGSPTFEFSFSIDHDSQGNLYNAGWTRGDLGSPNVGEEDVWIAKTRLDGTQEWIRQFGTSDADGLFIGGLDIDSQDNIFVTGYTNGSLGGLNAGSFDAWVARYDTNGNRIWIQQFGTPEYDYATNLAVDNSGNLYITGFTEGSLGDINNGAVDTWIAKFDAVSGSLLNFNGDQGTGDGDDTLYGTAGDDTINAGNGNNLIYASEGRNTITAGSGNDKIYGGASNDIINAGAGNNEIYASEGNNTITTGAGNDTIYAGAGNDTIYAGAGDDLIYAGEGNNTIYSGTGNNTVYSGSGSDLFALTTGFGATTINNFGVGKDVLGLTGGLTFEQLSITQGTNGDEFFTQISIANSDDLLANLKWVQADTITSTSFVTS